MLRVRHKFLKLSLRIGSVGRNTPFSCRLASSDTSTPWSRVSSEITKEPDSKQATRIKESTTVTASGFVAAYEHELAEVSAGALGRSQRALDTAYLALLRYREKNGAESKMTTQINEHNELRSIAFQKKEDLLIRKGLLRQMLCSSLSND